VKNFINRPVLKWIYNISERNMYSCCTIQVTGIYAPYRTQRDLSNIDAHHSHWCFPNVAFHVLYESNDNEWIRRNEHDWTVITAWDYGIEGWPLPE